MTRRVSVSSVTGGDIVERTIELEGRSIATIFMSKRPLGTKEVVLSWKVKPACWSANVVVASWFEKFVNSSLQGLTELEAEFWMSGNFHRHLMSPPFNSSELMDVIASKNGAAPIDFSFCFCRRYGGFGASR